MPIKRFNSLFGRRKKACVFICSLVILLIGFQSLKAQTVDSTKQNNDSLNAVILHQYNAKLAEISAQHKADSIKKADLEKQLNSLKTTDNLKKEDLQKEVEALNNKEVERIAQRKSQIDELRSSAKGSPVLGFFNDTLFLVYSNIGSFSAQDRAEATTKRIQRLADVLKFNTDSLTLANAETSTDLMFRDQIIMSISENDALWNNLTTDSLALKYKAIIGNAVVKYKAETSFSSLIKEVAIAFFVLVIVVLILFYIGKFFNWVAKKILKQKGKKLKGITIKSYTLFDAQREVNALLTVNAILKWFILLLVVYIALPILFGIFPWTKNYAGTLFSYILDPIKHMASGFWHYLPNLITIIVIIVVFRYILKALDFLRNEIDRENLRIPGFFADWANPTYQIVRVLIFAFMIVVIFPYLPGHSSPIFKGVSVFLGFLFTFGSVSSLSNIISGLVLTYMRLYKIGDRVKVGEVVGDVIEKSLLVTRVRTIKNEIISIPNSTVMSSHTINYSSDAPEKGLIIHTTVTIGYDAPWREVHQALIDAAVKTELVLKEPAPFVLQTALEDFYVAYQINAYIRNANRQIEIYSYLHQNIQDVFNERGIEIMSPHYRAGRDGNMTTIPADYLSKDYQAPAFNVSVKNNENKDV